MQLPLEVTLQEIATCEKIHSKVEAGLNCLVGQMALVREMKRGASVQQFPGKLNNNNKFHEYKCTKNRNEKLTETGEKVLWMLPPSKLWVGALQSLKNDKISETKYVMWSGNTYLETFKKLLSSVVSLDYPTMVKVVLQPTSTAFKSPVNSEVCWYSRGVKKKPCSLWSVKAQWKTQLKLWARKK